MVWQPSDTVRQPAGIVSLTRKFFRPILDVEVGPAAFGFFTKAVHVAGFSALGVVHSIPDCILGTLDVSVLLIELVVVYDPNNELETVVTGSNNELVSVPEVAGNMAGNKLLSEPVLAGINRLLGPELAENMCLVELAVAGLNNGILPPNPVTFGLIDLPLPKPTDADNELLLDTVVDGLINLEAVGSDVEYLLLAPTAFNLNAKPSSTLNLEPTSSPRLVLVLLVDCK
jgi:hypothetical protein